MDRTVEAEVNGEQPKRSRLSIDPRQSRISDWMKLAETGFTATTALWNHCKQAGETAARKFFAELATEPRGSSA
jgi:hypothetical protein